MSNTKLRIDESLEATIRRFQQIAERRLKTRVSLVKASKMLGRALSEVDFEEMDLRRVSIRGKPSKKRLKKTSMELDFRL